MAYTQEDKIAFIKKLYCPAKAISAETGSSWELILAQAAQETGWGEKVLPGSNNIFNIKADSSWKGEKKVFHVWEKVGGQKVWVDDAFRMYPDIKSSLHDRVKFLSDNSRYRKAGLFDEGTKGSLENEAKALQKAGYATDENYANGLIDVFHGKTMRLAIKEAEKAGCCEEKRDWAYPFNDSKAKPITDSSLFIGSPALASAAFTRTDNGFFPIGANGLWHGGVHFDSGSGTLLDQASGIRCIKDGEVVAYLVNKSYPEIEFSPGKKRAMYSTGFTLVRHRLELPVNKTASANPSTATNAGSPFAYQAWKSPFDFSQQSKPATVVGPLWTPVASASSPDNDKKPAESKSEVLTFYSLYMHQLDFEGYEANGKKARPEYWAEGNEYFVGEKAKDKQESATQKSDASSTLDDCDIECWPEECC